MRSHRILVVTDDPDIRVLYKKTLRNAGYSVHTTKDGVQALRRARRTPYDIVLLKPSSLHNNGLSVFENLRSVLPWLTGALIMDDGDLAGAVKAVRAGISDFVLKPCEAQEVVAVVAQLAERATAQKEYERLKAEQPFIAEVRRRADELAMLLEASLAFSTSLDPKRIVQLLAEEITKAVEATFCRVWLLDEEGDTLTVQAAYALREPGWNPSIGHTIALAHAPYHRRVVETGNPVVFRQDIPQIALSQEELEMAFTPDTRSGALFPMAVGERVLGVVSLGECRRWERIPRGVERLRVCNAMATRAALAVENARLYKALEEKKERLQRTVAELSRRQKEDQLAKIAIPA